MSVKRIGNRLAGVPWIRKALHGFFDEGSRSTLYQAVKTRERSKWVHRELSKTQEVLDQLLRTAKRHAVPVECPLALISQVQRSGGSLLSQLFDGHSMLHAHPYELKIGDKKKYFWPEIDLKETPEEWFTILFEDDVIEHFEKGYKKGQQHKFTFPFYFIARLQKAIFDDYIHEYDEPLERDIFNAYMTGYFGAWLNYGNLYGEKKYVTAFTPRLNMYPENMEKFFSVYPDGRLISVVRDPAAWYASALKHRPDKYGDLQKALNVWKACARSMIDNKARYANRALLISFSDLIEQTEAAMRRLCEWLDIAFEESLLTPTFNGRPIQANTSFAMKGPGIVKDTLNRDQTLGQSQRDAIREGAGELYRKVLGLCEGF